MGWEIQLGPAPHKKIATMKFLAVLLALLQLHRNAAAMAPEPSLGQLTVSGPHQTSVFLEKPKMQEYHFGDTACPCIGFDHVPGKVDVQQKDEHGHLVTIKYPKDLGSRCEAWDQQRHPLCKGGATDPPWCGQPWCFVDSCNCHIDVTPEMAEYLPDARYIGKPLFYSFATCGGKDLQHKEHPELGTAGCRCVGFHGTKGDIDITLPDGREVSYPASIGGTCKTWDEDRHPECKGNKDLPWCGQRWCYVDACSCKLADGHVPKISQYLPHATFTGKSFYYSYETCDSEDKFTKKYHPNACVNQATKDLCDKNPRCAWTGTRCLGKELVIHPLCDDIRAEIAATNKMLNRGAAHNASPLRAALLLMAALVATGVHWQA